MCQSALNVICFRVSRGAEELGIVGCVEVSQVRACRMPQMPNAPKREIYVYKSKDYFLALLMRISL